MDRSAYSDSEIEVEERKATTASCPVTEPDELLLTHEIYQELFRELLAAARVTESQT